MRSKASDGNGLSVCQTFNHHYHLISVTQICASNLIEFFFHFASFKIFINNIESNRIESKSNCLHRMLAGTMNKVKRDANSYLVVPTLVHLHFTCTILTVHPYVCQFKQAGSKNYKLDLYTYGLTNRLVNKRIEQRITLQNSEEKKQITHTTHLKQYKKNGPYGNQRRQYSASVADMVLVYVHL